MSKLSEEACQERCWKLASGLKLCPLNKSNAPSTFQSTKYLPKYRTYWRCHISISRALQNKTLVDFVHNFGTLIRQDYFGTMYKSYALHSFRIWAFIRSWVLRPNSEPSEFDAFKCWWNISDYDQSELGKHWFFTYANNQD